MKTFLCLTLVGLSVAAPLRMTVWNKDGSKVTHFPALVDSVTFDSSNFVDERDGRSYGYVILGNQVWMSQNLAYKPSSGNYTWINNDSVGYAQFGRLYDWNTAKSNLCPQGWHLPTDAEWKELERFLGVSAGDENTNDVYRGDSAGSYLKATLSWNSGLGLDRYGFKALGTGAINSLGSTVLVGENAFFWTATSGSVGAYQRVLGAASQGILRKDGNAAAKLSVRCVHD